MLLHRDLFLILAEDHVGQFLLKWAVGWIGGCRVLPEYGKLLDGFVLALSVILVLKVFDDNVREYFWEDAIKVLQSFDNLLGINLILQDLP